MFKILLPRHMSNCSASKISRLHVTAHWHTNTQFDLQMNTFIQLLYLYAQRQHHRFHHVIVLISLSFNSRLWLNDGLSSPALVPIQFSNQSGLSELHWVLHLSGASVYLPSPDTLHGGNVLAVHEQSEREKALKINKGATNKQTMHSLFLFFFSEQFCTGR